MKIVITDGYAVNPGDLSWSEIEKFGELQVFEHTKPEDVFARVRDADIVITNKTVLTRDIISTCENLKLICVSATGYNNVDIDAATSRGIPVCNAANYSSKSVAQHVLAVVLHMYNRIGYYSESVRAGRWKNSRDFTYFDHSIEEISGKSLGIIGFGAIGQEVASVFSALGANILVQEHPSKEITIPAGYNLLPRQELLNQSDIISLHIPLRETTKKMVDSTFLSAMKPSSILINTARGPIIDEDALYSALRSEQILAAGIDVMNQEPPENNKLFHLNNCIITPHQAWTSIQARRRLLEIVKLNIDGFLDGKIVNQVN